LGFADQFAFDADELVEEGAEPGVVAADVAEGSAAGRVDEAIEGAAAELEGGRFEGADGGVGDDVVGDALLDFSSFAAEGGELAVGFFLAFAESEQRAPTNIVQHRIYALWKLRQNTTASFTMWVGRTLNSNLNHAIVASGTTAGTIEPWVKRMQFDLIYSF